MASPVSPASPDTPMSPSKMPLLEEKGLDTPATKSSTESLRSPPDTPTTPNGTPRNEMEGALGSLLWGAFAPCVPVVIIVSVLLTSILHNRLDPSQVFLPATTALKNTNKLLYALGNVKAFENTGGADAYYLKYNHWTSPATLHTISSWTAKIIPFVTGASMALVAFFAGQRIMRSTQMKSEKLPSPHQVSILIGLLNGGGSTPLWDTIVYRWQNHESLVAPVPVAFWSLSFIVFMTFAIGAVDSWFGAVTIPVQISLVVPTTNISYSNGRNLNQTSCSPGTWQTRGCPSNAAATCLYPCSMTFWNTSNGERHGVSNAQQAAEVLMSNTYKNTIYNVTANGSNYYWLGDYYSTQKYDFIARSIAISTQCEVVTPNVTMHSQGGFSYHGYNSPSFSYSGEVGVDTMNATSPEDMPMVGIQFFNDSGLTQPVGQGSTTTDLFSMSNPMNFLFWSKGFPPVDTSFDQFKTMRKGKYLQNDINGDAVFVLSCSSTIHNAKYYWQNGTVRPQGLELESLASPYHGAVFSAPFAIDSALSHLSLEDAAALAAYQRTPEGLADVFSARFSAAAVALSSGVNVNVSNLQEWERDNNYLAVRVPFAPLYTLIALKAIYAIFALGLAVLAVFLTSPSSAQEIKERLTIDGLAAGFFEPAANQKNAVKNVQDLFHEHASPEKSEDTQKIGLLQTKQGGWLWVTTAVEQVGLGSVIGLGVDIAVGDAAMQGGDVGLAAQGFRLVKELL